MRDLVCVAMAWYDKKPVYGDVETGYGNTAALYPGIPADENELRWGFIRKVYGILSLQVVLTTLVAGMVVVTPAITDFFVRSPWSLIFIAFLPLICKFSLNPTPFRRVQNRSHPRIIADYHRLFAIILHEFGGSACAASGIFLTASSPIGHSKVVFLTMKDFRFSMARGDFSHASVPLIRPT